MMLQKRRAVPALEEVEEALEAGFDEFHDGIASYSPLLVRPGTASSAAALASPDSSAGDGSGISLEG